MYALASLRAKRGNLILARDCFVILPRNDESIAWFNVRQGRKRHPTER